MTEVIANTAAGTDRATSRARRKARHAMTGAGHCARAEQLLDLHAERHRQTAERRTLTSYLLEALVHAVLALAPDEEADQ